MPRKKKLCSLMNNSETEAEIISNKEKFCKQCGESFISRKDWFGHMKFHDRSVMMKRKRSYKKLKAVDEYGCSSRSKIEQDQLEEVAALCLMMLSRDKFSFEKEKMGSKFECLTCNKIFHSYQALGGHKASHKKINIGTKSETESMISEMIMIKKMNRIGTHQCPVCFKVFSTGQALGGHKRTHVIEANSKTKHGIMVVESPPLLPPSPSPVAGISRPFPDLNLPAPVEEEEEDRNVGGFWSDFYLTGNFYNSHLLL